MHALSALGDLYQNLALGAPKARVSPPPIAATLFKIFFGGPKILFSGAFSGENIPIFRQ